MKFKKLVEYSDMRHFIIVFDRGEEVTSRLTDFAETQGILHASFTGLGAFDRCTIAYYSIDSMEYENTEIEETVEVMSLAGNITLYEHKPRLHAHVVIGMRDATAHGGHLVSGEVGATIEISLTADDKPVLRTMNDDIGLPLIDLDAS